MCVVDNVEGTRIVVIADAGVSFSDNTQIVIQKGESKSVAQLVATLLDDGNVADIGNAFESLVLHKTASSSNNQLTLTKGAITGTHTMWENHFGKEWSHIKSKPYTIRVGIGSLLSHLVDEGIVAEAGTVVAEAGTVVQRTGHTLTISLGGKSVVVNLFSLVPHATRIKVDFGVYSDKIRKLFKT